MRDLISLLGVIAALAISTSGQMGDDSASAIRKVLEGQQTAWNRKDLEGFMAGYWNSPD
jgi:beta-aspartyl-peptidase (threonine type)